MDLSADERKDDEEDAGFFENALDGLSLEELLGYDEIYEELLWEDSPASSNGFPLISQDPLLPSSLDCNEVDSLFNELERAILSEDEPLSRSSLVSIKYTPGPDHTALNSD